MLHDYAISVLASAAVAPAMLGQVRNLVTAKPILLGLPD